MRSRLGLPESNRGRIIDSTAWLLGERGLALLVALGANVVVANYLGVFEFGQLRYAIALVMLFGTLVTAGLSGLVVRDLVRHHELRHEILGTVFGIRVVAGLLTLGALLAVTFLAGAGEGSRPVLIAIVGLGLLGRVTDVIEFWFQSQTSLRFVSIAAISATLVGAATKLLLVALGAPLVAFAWATALEQLLSGALLVVVYRRAVGGFRLWKFRANRARAYIRQSWPLILAGAANQVNLRVDQVLLGAMIGSAAVGTYAVAASLSEVWYFVPTAVAAATFPTIVRAKETSEELYRQRLRQLYGIFVWGAVGIAIVVTLVAGPVIGFLYSDEYAGAVDVLVIHVWTAPFLFMGVIFSKWLIVEGLLYTSLVRHGLGAALNIGLNLLLIPEHGPVGAAFATLVSYAAATYGASFLTRSTRPAAMDMTMGILLPIRLLRGSAALR